MLVPSCLLLRCSLTPCAVHCPSVPPLPRATPHVRSNGRYNCADTFCATEAGACAGNDFTAVGVSGPCYDAVGNSDMGDEMENDARCQNISAAANFSIACQAAIRDAYQGCSNGLPDMCAANAACASDSNASVGVSAACFLAVTVNGGSRGVAGCSNSVPANVTIQCQTGVYAVLAAGCSPPTSSPTSPPTSPPTNPTTVAMIYKVSIPGLTGVSLLRYLAPVARVGRHG